MFVGSDPRGGAFAFVPTLGISTAYVSPPGEFAHFFKKTVLMLGGGVAGGIGVEGWAPLELGNASVLFFQ